MSASPRPSLKGRLGKDSFFQLSVDLPRLVEVDVGQIAPNPEQPRLRIEPEALEELKESIGRHGLLQPILVRRAEDGQGWVLVAGQRRLAAVIALGRKTVAAIVTSGDPGEVALVENLQRQDLDPFEMAHAVQRLMERHGYSQAAMGGILGLKQNTVSALLAVNRLPDRVRQEYPTSDGVSKSLLIELASIPEPDEQLRLWDSVKAGGLTVRAVRAARRQDAVPRPARRAQPELATAALADARRLLTRLERATPETLQGDRQRLADLAALHAEIGRRLAVLLGEVDDVPRSG